VNHSDLHIWLENSEMIKDYMFSWCRIRLQRTTVAGFYGHYTMFLHSYSSVWTTEVHRLRNKLCGCLGE